MSLKGKTMVITGSSRGIGRAMALRCAQEGANVVITGKTIDPHPELEGTIHSVAEEVKAAGGDSLALRLDVRDEASIQEVIDATVDHFGGIDVLVNNASAISLTDTLNTPLKRFDLMYQVNVRATFACSQAAIPHLKKSSNPHILNMSPPLKMESRWFKDFFPYTYTKFGMSMCTLGMSAEFQKEGIAVNSLWPYSTIDTAAVRVHFPEEILKASRSPEIVADAAYAIITEDSDKVTGQFFIDEEVLRSHGITDFSHYMKYKDIKPFTDLYVE